MPAPAMTEAATNLGLAMQMLIDRPDLAARITSVRANGVPGWGGYPILFYVHGGEAEAQAWQTYLGPAAHRMDVSVDPTVWAWHVSITTDDVSVSITHNRSEVS